jgi:hypothetical protein
MKVTTTQSQSIQTKYLPATNHKGSRVKAWCERGSVTIGYNSSLNRDEAHAAAVEALIEGFLIEDVLHDGQPKGKNPWNGHWIGHDTGNGFVFGKL